MTLHSRCPGAQITGIDINSRAIAACRRKAARELTDPGIRFVCKGSTSDEADASYDAIFCLGVLRHAELLARLPARCDPILYFEQVERTANDLARCVKPGGFLVIWNHHFRFSDMKAYQEFDVALCSNEAGWEYEPLTAHCTCAPLVAFVHAEGSVSTREKVQQTSRP